MLSIRGQGMLLNAVYPCWIIQVLSRGTVMAVLCEGVPSIVVFEILLSYVKTFYYAPQHILPPGLLVRAVQRLCVSSKSKDLGL
jgi:hypothetical protein